MARKKKGTTSHDVKVIERRGDTLIVEYGGSRYEYECVRKIGRARHRSPAALAKLYASRDEWTERELLRRDLPLYWSKEWLRGQLERRTISQVAQLTPYTRAVLSKWAARHKLLDSRAQYIRREWDSGRYERYTDLADTLNVSESIISGVVGSSRRVHSPELNDRIALVAQLRRGGAATPKAAHEQARSLGHDLSYQQVYRAWRRLEVPEKE